MRFFCFIFIKILLKLNNKNSVKRFKKQRTIKNNN